MPEALEVMVGAGQGLTRAADLAMLVIECVVPLQTRKFLLELTNGGGAVEVGVRSRFCSSMPHQVLSRGAAECRGLSKQCSSQRRSCKAALLGVTESVCEVVVRGWQTA